MARARHLCKERERRRAVAPRALQLRARQLSCGVQRALLGGTLDWMELRDFLPPHAEPRLRKSALASSFVAALELARLGKAELQQDDTFGPLHLRRVPA